MCALADDSTQELSRQIEALRDYVLKICRGYLGTDDGEDGAQDVMYKALGAIHTFRGQASVKTWLYRIARFHCLNVLRARGHMQDVDEEYIAQIPDPASTGRNTVEEDIYHTQLLKLVEICAAKRIPPWDETDCSIFNLRFSDPPLTFGEIAKRLGKNENMIKYRYFERLLPTLEEVGRLSQEFCRPEGSSG